MRGRLVSSCCAVHAGRYTPFGAYGAPDGTIASVNGTPLDLRIPRQWRTAGTAVLIKSARRRIRPQLYYRGRRDASCCEVYCAQTGIQLTLRSDMPGVQVYSGNSIGSDLPRGKGGAVLWQTSWLLSRNSVLAQRICLPGLSVANPAGGGDLAPPHRIRFFHAIKAKIQHKTPARQSSCRCILCYGIIDRTPAAQKCGSQSRSFYGRPAGIRRQNRLL